VTEQKVEYEKQAVLILNPWKNVAGIRTFSKVWKIQIFWSWGLA